MIAALLQALYRFLTSQARRSNAPRAPQPRPSPANPEGRSLVYRALRSRSHIFASHCSRFEGSFASIIPIKLSLIGPMPQKPRIFLLQTLQAVGSEVPAIQECRHAHRDYDAGALFDQESSPHLTHFRLRDCEARPEELLQKGFQERRHRSSHSGKDQGARHALRLLNHVGRYAVFPVLLTVQQGNTQFGHIDALDSVSCLRGAHSISRGERVPIAVAAGIGVALNVAMRFGFIGSSRYAGCGSPADCCHLRCRRVDLAFEVTTAHGLA